MISMYQASVPVMIRALENLAAILAKGEEHAKAKNIAPEVFATSRLFPDMFTLAKQVQIASDVSKGAASRLAGVEPPSYEDNEADLAQLIERCRKTVAYLKTLKPAQIDGTEEKVVTWPMRSGTRSMKGLPYLVSHALPNVYFHVTTAYNILRHNGVELGKQDFLGKLETL
jgi:hypothetical protein